jgi:large subunit ribosomal protein L7/L12
MQRGLSLLIILVLVLALAIATALALALASAAANSMNVLDILCVDSQLAEGTRHCAIPIHISDHDINSNSNSNSNSNINSNINCNSKASKVVEMAQRLISRQVLQQFRSCRPTFASIPVPVIRSFTFTPSSGRIATTFDTKTTVTGKRWYQASAPRWEDEKVAEESVTDSEPTTPHDDEDYVGRHKRGLSDPDVPIYQNPLHHRDVSKDKIFEEDYGPDEVMPEVPLPPMSDDPDDIGAPPHLHALADEIVHLNMLEMTELVNKLQDHFGFEDTGYDGGEFGGAPQGAAKEEAPVEVEKTAFDLRLEAFDAKSKIKVIKEVRAITGLGLKEAKELVEGAPKVIQKGIKKEEAEKLKAVLEAVGATVEIV